MGVLGTFEIVIILALLIAVVFLAILSVKKLVNSNMSSNGKMTWMVIMIVFQLAGIIIFIIYHDYFLSKELRARN